MDRRKEPRLESRAPARIRALNGDESLSANGTLLNISGRGARIVVNQSFPINIPVRIDVGENLLLGDICYCRHDSGGYCLGVALSHSILDMSVEAHPSQPAERTSPGAATRY